MTDTHADCGGEVVYGLFNCITGSVYAECKKCGAIGYMKSTKLKDIWEVGS